MRRKVFRYSFLCALLFVFVTTVFMFTACGKEETVKEKEENKKENKKENKEEIVIKKDDIEDTEEVGSSDPELEEEAAFPILNDLIDRIQLTAAPLESTGASVSVYAENLSDGARASINSSQMPAASLIKLYIAGCVYEQMDFVKEQEVYAGETEELLRLMITVSDNDAANELVRKLGFGDASAGMEVVNEFCRLHGFADTHMGRLLLAPNDMDDNYTSVNDCGKFLREMNGNVLVGSEKLLDLMRQQERTGKIPAGVPENIETANKTGELSDVENDAAIIFGENGAYTVCVMMSGLSDTSAARSVIREISAQIYEYMCP